MEKNGKPESVGVISNVNLADEIHAYINNIEALKTSLPFGISVLQYAANEENKSFAGYLEANGELKSEDGETKTYNLGPEKVHEASRQRRKLDHFERGIEILPRTFVVSLISQYDYFIGRILRCLYFTKPDLLHSSERTLTFSQLLEFKKLDDAREHLIEKDVETLLRKSHVEQFDWLENKFQIKLRTDLPSWPHFVELTQRRNLFTHCDGIVSSQYLDMCDNHDVDFGDMRPSIGESLACPLEYFQQAFECTFEIGVKLAQVLWRKVLPDQIEKADQSIAYVSYELLLSEEYSLAIRLLDFFSCLKKWSNDERRRRILINHAQAHKWSGDQDQALKLLAGEDWTATSNPFVLAVAVLKDDFETAATTVRQIAQSGEISKKDYRTWPLFREFRKSESFLAAYKEVFGEEFVGTEQATDATEAQDSNAT